MVVDGYVDEPTCLGVPPYISTYPRYIAGAIWDTSPATEIIYHTIDQVRTDPTTVTSIWPTADIIVLIAGMIVPGKYLGGTPISVREAKSYFSSPLLNEVPKFLVGPWARFGCGLEGGRLALSSSTLSPPFDYIVTGDPEVTINQLFSNEGFVDEIELDAVRSDIGSIESFVQKGTNVVTQHPNHERGYLIAEIETYQGCPRFLSGGCSFCIEPHYGLPSQRSVDAIVREVERLYSLGIKAFRIGRQADLFTFGSKEMGDVEFPTPEPQIIEDLFSKIRTVAPDLHVLHIDNVNPGTLAQHPNESRAIAKTIIKYHTPGDVAAFGVESVDPVVIKKNNLKATEEEVVSAIRLLNEVGGLRTGWGLPHLLPGINLLYGLPGETKKTLHKNYEFLARLLEENLLVRRINIRQVIGLPATRLVEEKGGRIRHRDFLKHKKEIRENIDKVMLSRVAPPGTKIRSVFFERHEGNASLFRPLGTYPLLCYVPDDDGTTDIRDVFAIDHGPRSLTVLPYPLPVSSTSLTQWKSVPGIGSKRAARIRSAPDISSVEDIEEVLEVQLPYWLKRTMSFE